MTVNSQTFITFLSTLRSTVKSTSATRLSFYY